MEREREQARSDLALQFQNDWRKMIFTPHGDRKEFLLRLWKVGSKEKFIPESEETPVLKRG